MGGRGSDRDRATRAGAAILLVLVAVLVAGCDILGLGGYGSSSYLFGSGLPAMPSQIATFRTGSATVKLNDGTTVVLDQLRPGSSMETVMGSDVRWSNADGWNLTIFGAGASPGFAAGGSEVELDRIVDNQHLATFDASSCGLTVTTADATGLRGTASCTGLQWVDALNVPLDAPPSGIGDAFDAEITFAAQP